MEWDKWMEQHSGNLSKAWQVAFDLLMEHGEDPPIIRYIIRRKPFKQSRIDELPKYYSKEFNDAYRTKLYWAGGSWYNSWVGEFEFTTSK